MQKCNTRPNVYSILIALFNVVLLFEHGQDTVLDLTSLELTNLTFKETILMSSHLLFT